MNFRPSQQDSDHTGGSREPAEENTAECRFFDLCERVAADWNPDDWTHFKCVVAVSGGPDSVGMLRILNQLANQTGDSANLLVAHVNHQTRSDSHEDETSVQNLADQLGLVCVTVRLDKPDATSEQVLRDLRYDALSKIALDAGARYIATGHHRDDQIETILFRILRGTGISGLKGIPQFRRLNTSITLVRPLLNCSREEIESVLSELNQSYRLDITNAESKYTRNFLRNELLPLIESRFGPRSREAILRLSQQAASLDEFLDSQSADLRRSVIKQTPELIQLDCAQLVESSEIIVQHLLVDLWNQQHWPRGQMKAKWWTGLTRFAQGQSEERVLNLPGNIRAERISPNNHIELTRTV